VPTILNEDGTVFYGEDYRFEPDKDDIVRAGSSGYVVSYGEMLYRSLDAVEGARAEGLDVGLINRPTLNRFDEESLSVLGASPFVLVVESQNQLTGMGARLGTALLERSLTPRYERMGTVRVGEGGLGEQIGHQGLSPDHILKRIRSLAT